MAAGSGRNHHKVQNASQQPVKGQACSQTTPLPPHISQFGDIPAAIEAVERRRDPAVVHDWRSDGYPDAASYRLWSRSTCGLACIEGILRAELAAEPGRWDADFGGQAPGGFDPVMGPGPATGHLASEGERRWLPGMPKAALIDRAIAFDVLVPRPDGSVDGLFYAPAVRWLACDYGIEAHSCPDLPLCQAAQLVASGDWYAILSVSWEIRRAPEPPTHTGGHLVLALCAESDGDAAIVFHNPSGMAPTPDKPDRPNTASAVRMRLADFAPYYAGRGILVRKGSPHA